VESGDRLGANYNLHTLFKINTSMQKTILTVIILFSLNHIFGQTKEIRLAFNSGLFSFSGQSADNQSVINFSNTKNSGYTNNPYGSLGGISYGLSANFQKVTKKNMILGFDIGFENLRSKVNIVAVNGFLGTSAYVYSANGQTFLNSNFINLFPNIGHRWLVNKISIDVIGGLDVAYCPKATEKGSATATNDTKYVTSVDRKTINTDIRPRIQFSIGYLKTGVYVGYSYGLSNYRSGYVGGTNECFARLLRFGLTYKLV
jgi:hypothetical protein